MRFSTILLLIVVAAASAFMPAAAHADAASACRTAARQAEQRFAIPPGLLQAISLVETGRYRHGETVAWPWTVNIAGKGRYFDTRAQAESFVRERKNRGADSIDIGCFQINTRWHGGAFDTPFAMFEPAAGAAYAASFLTRLHGELGDWNAAVNSYHSRHTDKGAAYGKKIAAALERLGREPAQDARPPLPVTLAPPALRDGATGRGGVRLTLFTGARPLVAPAAAPLLTRKE